LRQPAIEAAVRKRWGDGVFGADGRIDRKLLGGIVFAPPPNGPRDRKFLERLTHPEIVRIIKERLDKAARSGAAAAVIDAPLLAEAGLDGLCDKLVFVDTPLDIRLQRALARGWRKEDFAAREDAQKSLDFKRNHADEVIDNSGSPEQTQAQVRRLWQILIR
jgi:dephospho-CoA kinase